MFDILCINYNVARSTGNIRVTYKSGISYLSENTAIWDWAIWDCGQLG